jgi:hypothetical protein
MGPRNSHYRQRTKTLGADVPHSQVAKLAENPVAHRHARSFVLPDTHPHSWDRISSGTTMQLRDHILRAVKGT